MIDRSAPDPANLSTDRRRQNRRQVERRSSDRRQDERYRVVTQLRFMRSTGGHKGVLPGELLDVSLSGVRIIIDEPLATTESLLIEIREGDDLCLNLTARLVWCVPFDDTRFQAGCDLSADLSRSQLARLRQLTNSPR